MLGDFWYNLTINNDGSYQEMFECDYFCTNCGVRRPKVNVIDCVASSISNSSWQLFYASDLDACTFPPAPADMHLGLILGVSLGVFIIALLIAIPVRRKFFSEPKIAYLPMPQSTNSDNFDL